MSRPLTCDQCGRELEPDDRFCQRCGHARSASAYLDVAKQAEPGVSASSGGRKTPMSSAFAALLEQVKQATRGSYDIKRELGHGGMAAVYLAHHHELNRQVALKVMLPFLALIEGMAQRFRDEARTAARLDHPNIVIIHSVEERDGMLFFAMKYINGCTLETALRRAGPMPVHVAQLVLVQVASALHYAHTEGVIHRDVKPSNVMLDRHGTPIVTDFGIAKAAESTKLTQTGSLLGTPIAMSPEQWKDKPATPKSDQYALGVLAYELLVGQPPFEGDRLSIREAHISQAPAPIVDTRHDCPPALANAILRMLAKSPNDRWPTIADAIPAFSAGLPGDLSPIRRHLATIVARESGSRSSDEPATPVSPLPTPTFPPRISKPQGIPVPIVPRSDNPDTAATIVESQSSFELPDRAAAMETIVTPAVPESSPVSKQPTPVPKQPTPLPKQPTPLPKQPTPLPVAQDVSTTPVTSHRVGTGDNARGVDTPIPQPPADDTEATTAPIVVDPHPKPFWQRKGIQIAAGVVVLLALSSWIARATLTPSGNGKAATITFLTADGSLALGDTMTLHAVVRSASGDTLKDHAVQWHSSDEGILTVSQGHVVPHAAGTAEISAVAGDAKAIAIITVTHASPNATLDVTPGDTSLPVGASATLTAVAHNADGGVVTGRTVRWRSSDTTVALVDSASGRVTARGLGNVAITAIDESGARGVSTLVVAAARPTVKIAATTRVLSVGATTLLTPSVRDEAGTVVQQGVSWSSSDPTVATVDGQGHVVALKLGRVRVTARTDAGASGTLDLSVSDLTAVSAGGDQTCALRSDGAHQCWTGANGGTLFTTPRFTQMSAGSTHACGLNATGEAYCWGENDDGQLGDGSGTDEFTPVRVSGGSHFLSISAGRSHTCGVTVVGTVYCWGSNAAGQLGTATSKSALRVPTLVSMKELATEVATGATHSCALVQSGKVYCWGIGTSGQLGVGSMQSTNAPVIVNGRETYRKIVIGEQHSCGLTREGEILCWGSNRSGQLGNGSEPDRGAPLHIKTSGKDRKQFSDVAAGANHTCALRRDGQVLCWGNGEGGQLGSDGLTRAMTPAEIAGTLKFRSITAGGNHTCGVAEDRVLYCWGSTLRGRASTPGTSRGKPTRMPNS